MNLSDEHKEYMKAIEALNEKGKAIRDNVNSPPHYKYCGRCGKNRPVDDFAKNSVKPDGLQERCTPCRKEHYSSKKDDIRERSLKRKYGISFDDYTKLLSEQGHKCAICSTDRSGKKSGVFCVDHDHETGAVRGLLCSNCNRGIGLLGDTPLSIYNAWRYVSGNR